MGGGRCGVGLPSPGTAGGFRGTGRVPQPDGSPADACVEDPSVALTNLDRDLLKRCLARHPGAWNDFVDRFLGLVYHVVHHTAHLRSTPLRPEDVEDLAAEVLLQIVARDYAVLREFRG